MKQSGKNDISALVSQDKTVWDYSETNQLGYGLIDASDITAGSWNGTFNFNIKLENSLHTINSMGSSANDIYTKGAGNIVYIP